MNLKLFSSALLIAGLAAPSAFAETGTITFKGAISNVTCTVDGEGSGGPNFEVDLGSVSAGDFAAPGDNQGMHGFRIQIGKTGENSCTNGTRVYATFDADGALVDPNTGMVRVNGTAKGVQIRLFNETGDKINAWSADQKVVTKVVEGNMAMIFHAAAFERTDDMVAGTANGQVKYTINYEAP
ncbi:type 1 fimbrial protein [Bacillus sp. NP157]|nr:type 1 fimbrial protein [Bacillus sp. NP157]